jgi:hypothetical protein
MQVNSLLFFSGRESDSRGSDRMRRYVQEKEFNFWIRDPVAKKPLFLMYSDPVSNDHLARLEGTERLVLVRGDQEIPTAYKVELFAYPEPAVFPVSF